MMFSLAFYFSPSVQRNFGCDEKQLTFEGIGELLATHDLAAHIEVEFLVSYTHQQRNHLLQLHRSAGEPVKIPQQATDRRLLWGYNVELDGKPCLYLSSTTVESFISTKMQEKGYEPTNYAIVDARTNIAPIFSIDTAAPKFDTGAKA